MKELSDKYDEFEEDFITKLPNWFEYSRDEDVFELSFDYICDILADIDEDEYEWFVEYYSTLKTSNPFFKINNPITNTYLLKEYLKR